MTDLSQAEWRKASRSNEANTGCVEVTTNLPDVTAVRDSKSPADGSHVMARATFAAFLKDVRAGNYDL
jgi:hypothetical protein